MHGKRLEKNGEAGTSASTAPPGNKDLGCSRDRVVKETQGLTVNTARFAAQTQMSTHGSLLFWGAWGSVCVVVLGGVWYVICL